MNALRFSRNDFGFGLMILGIFLGGCAGDRDLNDQKRDQVSRDLSRLKEVEGFYEGQLVKKNSEEVLATIGFELEARTVPNSLNERSAVLQGNLVSAQDPALRLPFTSSYFDPETGIFETESPWIQADDQLRTRTVTIKGRFRGSVFEGRLGVFEFPEAEYEVRLVRQSTRGYRDFLKLNEGEAVATTPGRAWSLLGLMQGLTNSDPPTVVRLSLSSKSMSPETNFLNLVSNHWYVRVSLDFSPNSRGLGIPIDMGLGRWEPSLGRLFVAREQNSGSVGTFRTSLRCGLAESRTKLSCEYFNSNFGVPREILFDVPPGFLE
jgi:hypothetical protein